MTVTVAVPVGVLYWKYFGELAVPAPVMVSAVLPSVSVKVPLPLLLM